MDASFQFAVESLAPMPGLRETTRAGWWGGELHRQSPRTFAWGPHVQLVQTDVPEYIRRILEPLVPVERLTYFLIQSDGLDLLEREVNGGEVDWSGARLTDLVRHQLKASASWAVVFEPHSDQIDRVGRSDVETTIQTIEANLKRDDTRQGFVIASP